MSCVSWAHLDDSCARDHRSRPSFFGRESKPGAIDLTRIMAHVSCAKHHDACQCDRAGLLPSKMTDAIDDHGAQEVIGRCAHETMGIRDGSPGIAIYLASEGKRLRLRVLLFRSTADWPRRREISLGAKIDSRRDYSVAGCTKTYSGYQGN